MSPALLEALTSTNLGEDEFSVRSELLISKVPVNFILSLLLLLVIWAFFYSLNVLKDFKLEKKKRNGKKQRLTTMCGLFRPCFRPS